MAVSSEPPPKISTVGRKKKPVGGASIASKKRKMMGSAKVATMKLLLALCPLFASATPTIWPMPSSLVENGANLTVGASTTFFVEKAAVAGSSSSSSSALLTEAFTRYTSLTFPHGITFDDTDQVKVKDSKELTSLVVSVEELDESHPQLSTDETYTLSISSSGAKLTAPTVYGALKGLETFSQLVLFDFDTRTYVVPAVDIEDSPRFAHRGEGR